MSTFATVIMTVNVAVQVEYDGDSQVLLARDLRRHTPALEQVVAKSIKRTTPANDGHVGYAPNGNDELKVDCFLDVEATANLLLKGTE